MCDDFSTPPSGALIVASDGTGSYTSITYAIGNATSGATVWIKAVIGQTLDSSSYSGNTVTIVAPDSQSYAVNANAIVNTAKQSALRLGNTGILIANSYLEASNYLVYSQGSAYVNNSQLTITSGNTVFAYTTGYGTIPGKVVLDACTLSTGSSTGIVLGSNYGSGNAASGSSVLVRNSNLGAGISSAGWAYKDYSVPFVAADYGNTGSGASTSGRNTSFVNVAMIGTQLEAWSLDNVMAAAYAPQGSTYSSGLWDSSVYGAIIAADAAANALATSSGSSSAAVSSASSSAAASSGSLSAADVAAVSSATASPAAASASTSSSASASSAASSSATSSSSAAASTCSGIGYVVSSKPSDCQYASISAAIAALPNDGTAQVITVLAGEYNEQINITRWGKVTIRGETNVYNDYTGNKVKVWIKGLDTSGFEIYNVDFENTAGPSGGSFAALAGDFYGYNVAVYGCSLKGYQDTLLANVGTMVFSNCYIEGSVDFIWGYAKTFFHNCYIASNTAGSCITANAYYSTIPGGFVIDSSYVTYTSSYGSTFGTTYLGRPWSAKATVAYTNSYLDKHIATAGWQIWSTLKPQTDGTTFAEYSNVGPGAWDSSSRVSFATNITDATAAAAYSLSGFMGDVSWLNMTAYNMVPTWSFPTTSSSSIPSISAASGASSSVSSIAASSVSASVSVSAVSSSAASTSTGFPTSGTVPPSDAVLVSQDSSVAGSYASITAALASLDDTSPATIFIYPGTYTEQFSVDRTGPVTFIGYQVSTPGLGYASNQVTIVSLAGVSTSGGSGNAGSAAVNVLSTANFYNIIFNNKANVGGSISNYAALAANVQADAVGFYGCSFVGWQDTLLANTGRSVFFSCYIEGAIDFVWGYSTSYFKSCTTKPMKAKSAITAHSRKTADASGAYVFDSCLVSGDMDGQAYLGRPYSQYARVCYKYSYLDSVVQPAGWKIWSTTDPRNGSVTFAEYQNSGPGAWEQNADARVSAGLGKLLDSDTYTLSAIMSTTDWIDMTNWDAVGVPAGVTSSTSATPSTGAASSTAAVASATASTASSYITPPTGALVVAQSGVSGAYDSVASAIAALPSDSTEQTIFIYPGASGVDTQADQSNSDSAVLHCNKKTKVRLHNINISNTFGTTKNYASLAIAAEGYYLAAYGCQFSGNQDAFLANTGSTFVSDNLMTGSIDFIWGNGLAYFLGSDIVPNVKSVSITAHKRTSTDTAAGYAFDQCNVYSSARNADGTVNLGRPWNANAKVGYIRSNLGSCISSAGWSTWSSSDPRTDNVTCVEYQNTGAGSDRSGRASFSSEMNDAAAAAWQIDSFFGDVSWINFANVRTTPFTAGSSSVSSTASATSSSASASSAASSVVSTSSASSSETAYALLVSSSETSSSTTSSTTKPVTVTVYLATTSTRTSSVAETVLSTSYITKTAAITSVATTYSSKVVSEISTSTIESVVTKTAAPSTSTVQVTSTSTIEDTTTGRAATVTLDGETATVTPSPTTKKASTSTVWGEPVTKTITKTAKSTSTATCKPVTTVVAKRHHARDLLKRDDVTITKTTKATETLWITGTKSSVIKETTTVDSTVVATTTLKTTVTSSAVTTVTAVSTLTMSANVETTTNTKWKTTTSTLSIPGATLTATAKATTITLAKSTVYTTPVVSPTKTTTITTTFTKVSRKTLKKAPTCAA
ncbi:hypothetical protein YB2330_005271 [Saitoella coloradoensis]